MTRAGLAGRTLAWALWLAALLTAGTGWADPGPANDPTGDPVSGRQLFVDKGCVRCHAIRGAGGTIGPDLGRSHAKSSFYEIAARMWNHSGMMGDKMEEFRIPRPSFAGDELADLVYFLYFLNYFDEPGDARLGKVLFTEKHCIQCHRLGGEGGTVGPSFETMPRGIPPLRIAQGLWNHGPEMIAALRRRGLAVPSFEGDEIVDLFAYMRSQGESRMRREFQSAGDAASGEALFTAKGCDRCHSILGDGDDIGPDLGRHELRGSVTQLAGRMWNHWPAMADAMAALDMRPPQFEGDELADLFAYIFISRYDGEPGDVSRGRVLYQTRGCARCHGDAGTGRSAPALRELTTSEGKADIAQRMWNHASEMSRFMRARNTEWPRFEASELADLIAMLSAGWPEQTTRSENDE